MARIPQDFESDTYRNTKILDIDPTSIDILEKAWIQQQQRFERTDQSTCLWTTRQKSMAWWHKTFGCVGIAYYVKEIARWEIETAEEQKLKRINGINDQLHLVDRFPEGSSATWQRIIEDWNKGPESRTLYYLSSIPSELLLAIIHGDLPCRMQDPKFRSAMENFTNLDDVPGVYNVYLAFKNETVIPSSQPGESVHINRTGLNLTIAQLSDLLQAMRRYMDSDDQEFLISAQEIDSCIGKPDSDLDYTSGQRRYAGGGNHDNFGKHRIFVDLVQQDVVDVYMQSDTIKPDDHLKRCFAYSGLSNSILTRTTNHWVHQGKSPLFGLITATVQWLWPDVYAVQHYTYTMFRATRPADVSFLEKLLTIVSCSYYFDLGMSFAYAGTYENMKKYSKPHTMSRFQKNIDFINGNDQQDRNIRTSEDLIKEFKSYLGDPVIQESKGSNLELAEKVHNQMLALEESKEHARKSDTMIKYEKVSESIATLMDLSKSRLNRITGEYTGRDEVDRSGIQCKSRRTSKTQGISRTEQSSKEVPIPKQAESTSTERASQRLRDFDRLFDLI